MRGGGLCDIPHCLDQLLAQPRGAFPLRASFLGEVFSFTVVVIHLCAWVVILLPAGRLPLARLAIACAYEVLACGLRAAEFR